MTSRRWPTRRWPTVWLFVRRPSSRASASGRFWPAPCPPCPFPAESGCAPHDPRIAPRTGMPAGTLASHLRGEVIVALTGRAPALLTLGLIAVILQPTMTTVRIWWLVTACAIGFDLLLALSPHRLVISRERVHQVRLGVSGSTTLWLTNPTQRRLRGIVRDAWQPSAGAAGDRHAVTVHGGERVALRTPLTPTRRGDRRADRVTVRSLGPLGLATRRPRSRTRALSAHCRRSLRESTCPAGWPSCDSSTADPQSVFAELAPSSTLYATTWSAT